MQRQKQRSGNKASTFMLLHSLLTVMTCQVSSLSSDCLVPTWLIPAKTKESKESRESSVVNMETDFVEREVDAKEGLGLGSFKYLVPVLRPGSAINPGVKLMRELFHGEVKKKSSAGKNSTQAEADGSGTTLIGSAAYLRVRSRKRGLDGDGDKGDSKEGKQNKKLKVESLQNQHLLL